MLRLTLRLLGGLLLWLLVEFAQTTPFLGLPFEDKLAATKPVFLDCYAQAKWDGHRFVETGRTICLGK